MEPKINSDLTPDQIAGAIKDVLGPVIAEKLADERKAMLVDLAKAQPPERKFAPSAPRAPFADGSTSRVIQTKSGFVGTYRPKTFVHGEKTSAGRAPIEAMPLVGEMDGEQEFYPCGFVARAMWAIMSARAQGFGLEHAKDIAHRAGFKVTAKALDTTVIQDGGAMIPGEFADEIIEGLIPYSVVRSAGPTMMPIRGQMTIPFINAQANAYWVGENATITKSQPTTGALLARENKLACLVPLSNEMLRLGGSRVEQALMRHLGRVAAAKEDSAFLVGDGTQGSPKGFRHWAANSVSTNGTPTVTTVTNEMAQLQQKLADAYVLVDKGAYFMAPRSYFYLKSLRTSNGEYAFPEMQNDKLLGMSVFSSPQIPINESTNQSRIYFVNMSDVLVFDGSEIRIDSFPGGTYDNGGTLVSGISNDQTVLRLIKSTDLVPQYRGNEVSMATGVVYGV
jgi:HK97 family phage major capsid protein